MQQGIYTAPCDIRPNKNRTNITCVAIKEQKLWIIEYRVKNVGNGCAVVKAANPKEAETLLRSEGTFNGVPHLYEISRIEEIVPSPDSMLIAEQLATDSEHLT